MTSISYIAVHGGAGFHGMNHEKEVKYALRKACAEGLMMLKRPPPSVAVTGGSAGVATSADGLNNMQSDPRTCAGSSLDMVERAIMVLEDDARLNAGYGSSLTMDGTVECDAAIMGARDGGLFGSVGAVSGVKNPICLARSILDYSCIPNKFGRVPPLTLTSSGAQKFALGRVETVSPETLIAPLAHGQWKKWKARLESLEQEREHEVGFADIQDTVGAVAFDPAGVMAAGVSSGGLLLKWPGRVGEAGVFGAGCWANQIMACSVSGTGEHIIREHIARRIGALYNPEADPHEILDGVLRNFWETFQDTEGDGPSIGVLLLASDRDCEVRLWCAFTTASMAVGYATSAESRPKASGVILRPRVDP